MIRMTLNLIGEQISEFWRNPCTYSRLILAPVISFALLLLASYLDMTFIAQVTESHTTYRFFLNAVAILNMLLWILTPFYAIKSLIEIMRYQVLDESPRRYFGIYWVKQSYLFMSYLYLIPIFSYGIVLLIFFPIENTILSGLIYIISILLSLVYIAYLLTAYPMNLVAVATDKHIDFFKILQLIGPWRWSVLIINILHLVVLYLLVNIINLTNALESVPMIISTIVVFYFIQLITLGSFAKVCKLHLEASST